MLYKLGDIVEKIVGDVDRYTSGYEFYIGGEHYESGSIEITDRGVIKEKDLGYQFHFPFKKGDVLFMTKNPHLRKAGRVNFDGICSIASFVLRTKDENILRQDYLPLVVQTNAFWEYLEANKSGSVNYFITWKTLADYEFDLPPLEEQKRLADILWAAEDLKQKIGYAIKETKQYLETYIEHTIFNLQNKAVCIKELVDINKNSVPSKLLVGDYDFSYIDIGSISRPKYLDLTLVKTFTSFKEAPGRARRCVDEGDILMSSVRPNLQSFAIVPNGKYIASTGFIVMKPKADYLRNIIFFSLFTSRFMKYCDGFTTGSNYPAISSEAVGKFTINLPTEKEGVIISEILDKIQATIDSLISQEQTVIQLEKSLLN